MHKSISKWKCAKLKSQYKSSRIFYAFEIVECIMLLAANGKDSWMKRIYECGRILIEKLPFSFYTYTRIHALFLFFVYILFTLTWNLFIWMYRVLTSNSITRKSYVWGKKIKLQWNSIWRSSRMARTRHLGKMLKDEQIRLPSNLCKFN